MHTPLRYALPMMAVLLAAALIALAVPAGAQPPTPCDDRQPLADDTALANGASLYPSPNERIGVGLQYRFGDITDYNVAQLESGWWADWSSRQDPPHPNGMDYVQLVSVHKDRYPPQWDTIAERAAANPGSLWLVGNEPEALFQENRSPAEYAAIYHDVYAFLKRIDPTAQVAIGGVILPSPLRLQWIDAVLAQYQSRYGVPMPVDVWNIHMQMVNEVSCAYDPGNCWGAEIPNGINANYGITMTLSDNASYTLFTRLVRDMRVWMNARGFRNKPLVISEYGVLLPSTYICECDDPNVGDAIVINFMTRTFQFLLTATDAAIGYPADGNRLVQSWLWYTLNDQPYNWETGEGFNGGLFDHRNSIYPGTLTKFGQAFKSFVPPLKVPYRDVVPAGLRAGLRDPNAGPSGTVTITVQVANLGNTGVASVTVRLFDGDPGDGGVQIDTDKVIPSLGIRHTAPGMATFAWTTPPEGIETHSFYVVVDPDDAITESREDNNTGVYVRRFNDYQVFLPIITKALTVTTVVR